MRTDKNKPDPDKAPPAGAVDYYGEAMNRREDKEKNRVAPNAGSQEIGQHIPGKSDTVLPEQTEEETITPQDLVEETGGGSIQEKPGTNEGGIYPPDETFDEDSPSQEAGTPGHPGIDEGTD